MDGVHQLNLIVMYRYCPNIIYWLNIYLLIYFQLHITVVKFVYRTQNTYEPARIINYSELFLDLVNVGVRCESQFVNFLLTTSYFLKQSDAIFFIKDSVFSTRRFEHWHDQTWRLADMNSIVHWLWNKF